MTPDHEPRISLGHGEGGRLSRQLIREIILNELPHDSSSRLDDAARLPAVDGPLAMTTDSYVVSPRFFPGGDIGSLAVYGTVNDLAVNGAEPLYLTLSLIIEEGLAVEELRQVMKSVAQAALKTDVSVVAGDTKVVPRGAADGLFINTAGVGRLRADAPVGPAELRLGDALLVSGSIGRHGMAVMAAREQLGFEPAPVSDCAPLHRIAASLLDRFGAACATMRDATRGGVAAVLHEWAEASGKALSVTESLLPIPPSVRGPCELLGIDPIHSANEGVMMIAIDPNLVEPALDLLAGFPEAAGASQIGFVKSPGRTRVTLVGALGVERPLDDPLGAQLPRIC